MEALIGAAVALGFLVGITRLARAYDEERRVQAGRVQAGRERRREAWRRVERGDDLPPKVKAWLEHL